MDFRLLSNYTILSLPVVSQEVQLKRAKVRGVTRVFELEKRFEAKCFDPMVWPSPYACAQPYHPVRYQATMDDSCFALVRPHQHGIADICRGRSRS